LPRRDPARTVILPASDNFGVRRMGAVVAFSAPV